LKLLAEERKGRGQCHWMLKTSTKWRVSDVTKQTLRKLDLTQFGAIPHDVK